PTTHNRSGDGFAGVFADAAKGKGVLLFLLLAAFGWGALHALSPGHGKAMVAAYLVGTRGTARHALALGGTVTVTHTIGVSALGVLLGAISQHQVGLGLLLITAFSIGLASTLSFLGLGVVYARGLLGRLNFGGEFAAVLPSLSAVVIVAAGVLLTVHGIGQV